MTADDVPGWDRLSKLLEAQRELQLHAKPLNRDPSKITDPEERAQFIKDMVLALEDELHEALGEVGWKPWAESRHVNRDAYMGELIDAFHFFMNLMLVVDMTADELFLGYMEKRQRNKARWAAEGGYTGLDKCPGCKRAIDDIAHHLGLPRERVFAANGLCLECAGHPVIVDD
jgi:hypothetical protein